MGEEVRIRRARRKRTEPTREADSGTPDVENEDTAGKDAQNNRDSVRETVNDWLAGIGY